MSARSTGAQLFTVSHDTEGKESFTTRAQETITETRAMARLIPTGPLSRLVPCLLQHMFCKGAHPQYRRASVHSVFSSGQMDRQHLLPTTRTPHFALVSMTLTVKASSHRAASSLVDPAGAVVRFCARTHAFVRAAICAGDWQVECERLPSHQALVLPDGILP
jgi:hypothetical protein